MEKNNIMQKKINKSKITNSTTIITTIIIIKIIIILIKMEIIDLIKIEIIALMIITEIKITINSETMIDSSKYQTFLGNQMLNSKIIIMPMNKMMKKIMIIGQIIQLKIMKVGIGEITI